MDQILVTIHISLGTLTVGVLFLQSLMMLMQRRLANQEYRQGVQILQRRIQKTIYYPLLLLSIMLGAWQAGRLGSFSSAGWLHWKIVLVLFLVSFGFLIDQQLASKQYSRPLILVVHILTLVVATAILYLANYRPF